MRIQETAMRPALTGGGWSKQTRVYDLAAGQSMPASAVAVNDAAPLADWQDAVDAEPQPNGFAAVPPAPIPAAVSLAAPIPAPAAAAAPASSPAVNSAPPA